MKLTITIAVYHYLKSQGKARICNQSTNTRKKKERERAIAKYIWYNGDANCSNFRILLIVKQHAIHSWDFINVTHFS